MFRLFLNLFLLSFLLSSCNPKYYYLDAKQYESNVDDAQQLKLDSLLFVETKFGGDAIDYIIFEVDIQNNTSQDVTIKADDFQLEVFNDGNNDKPDLYFPLEKETLKEDILIRREQVKKAKKGQTIADVIFTGLNVIAFAVGPGGSPIDALAYSAESTAYIIEDRRYYNLVQGSLEEQLMYIDDWVLSKHTLAPDEKASFDLLFPRIYSNVDCNLSLLAFKQLYNFEYRLFIAEGK